MQPPFSVFSTSLPLLSISSDTSSLRYDHFHWRPSSSLSTSLSLTSPSLRKLDTHRPVESSESVGLSDGSCLYGSGWWLRIVLPGRKPNQCSNARRVMGSASDCGHGGAWFFNHAGSLYNSRKQTHPTARRYCTSLNSPCCIANISCELITKLNASFSFENMSSTCCSWSLSFLDTL